LNSVLSFDRSNVELLPLPLATFALAKAREARVKKKAKESKRKQKKAKESKRKQKKCISNGIAFLLTLCFRSAPVATSFFLKYKETMICFFVADLLYYKSKQMNQADQMVY
jgi:uncharacterized membrane protein